MRSLRYCILPPTPTSRAGHLRACRCTCLKCCWHLLKTCPPTTSIAKGCILRDSKHIAADAALTWLIGSSSMQAHIARRQQVPPRAAIDDLMFVDDDEVAARVTVWRKSHGFDSGPGSLQAQRPADLGHAVQRGGSALGLGARAGGGAAGGGGSSMGYARRGVVVRRRLAAAASEQQQGGCGGSGAAAAVAAAAAGAVMSS
jgi:hypothetical protein